MSKRKQPGHLFHSAADERRFANPRSNALENEQFNSPAYRLAFDDIDFLLRDEMRPVRFLLELAKPEILLKEHGVNHSVVIFGSARTCDMEQALSKRDAARQALGNDEDNSRLHVAYAKAEAAVRHAQYYEQARALASMVSERSGCQDCPKLHVITGGGPGVMEAANRGASEAGAESVGLNIVLPHEQQPNAYITPELCFQFHYFAMRKMHFMLRARALVAFPGGFGTMDELFETLTLIQTGKIKHLPVLLFGKDYWQKLINFELMVEEGMISREDLSIFQFVDDVERAWQIIRESLETD